MLLAPYRVTRFKKATVSAELAGRSVVFLTAQSRTGDIEQILIRGVHGPGELHAILVEEACLIRGEGPCAPPVLYCGYRR
jgi:hypothetical protein